MSPQLGEEMEVEDRTLQVGLSQAFDVLFVSHLPGGQGKSGQRAGRGSFSGKCRSLGC